MKTTDDPIRLRSLAKRGSVLERGLETAQSSGPTDEQLKALERSVLGGIGVAAAVEAAAQVAKPHAVASAATWVSAGTAKLLLALTTAVTVGGAVLAARHVVRTHSGVEPLHRQAAARVLSKDVPVPMRIEVAPTEAPRAPVAPALVPGIASSTEPSAPALKKKSVKAATQTAELAAFPATNDEDIPLLKRAGEVLANAPARALALADEHKRRFPESVMDQERELIAITALAHLGRLADAQKRADNFSRTHAGSVYQRQIQAAIGGTR